MHDIYFNRFYHNYLSLNHYSILYYIIIYYIYIINILASININLKIFEFDNLKNIETYK
jgi:hypothetical protein